MVHHVLPFLPSSKELLASHLTQCSSTLHLAFTEAFNSAMGSFAVPPDVQGSLAMANRLLAEFEGEGGKRTQVADLVHLQCLILMIINVDNYGPVSLTREHEGPAKATLLGRAAGLAYSMGIPHEAMTLNPVGDVESDQYIRVRAWWTLVILDRWNAISTATPLVIAGDSIVLPHNLKPVLGEANYRFTCRPPVFKYTIRCHTDLQLDSAGVHHGTLDACVRYCSCRLDTRSWGKSLRNVPPEYGDVACSLPRRHPPHRGARPPPRILALSLTGLHVHALGIDHGLDLGGKGIRPASDLTSSNDEPAEPPLHILSDSVSDRDVQGREVQRRGDSASEQPFGRDNRSVDVGRGNPREDPRCTAPTDKLGCRGHSKPEPSAPRRPRDRRRHWSCWQQ